MSQNVVLSGWGVTSAYAPDFPALIKGLTEKTASQHTALVCDQKRMAGSALEL
ncbi:hypothetical protein FHU10_4581 [Serratia fonticola]|uniref:Uncharacterized protein n=1 Tax=Serratia fonticola TaxID=47917 RepID=A0A559TBD3_SERFO|nr:hypothetical protein [Serratia fonticola]TVZ71924.1 hypothetical protein FHU10_4581 [Serratia fonticola]